MNKTLLLVFIHGFQGGDDTFARFPPHLRALLTHALPQLNIVQIQYPKFDTRGDFQECVATFKEWLTNKVIDLEVELGTPSPTIDPGVRVILIGHSMGGIVGAETILSITKDTPIHMTASSSSSSFSAADKSAESPSFMFPSVLGLLAFDTPYLGISPGVLAHNAETHIQTAKSAWSAYNYVSNAFGSGAAGTATVDASRALPAAAAEMDAATVPAWQRWGRYAVYAGAAGALLAGGAAAYANRGQLSEGWGWATSHLEFVGCLAREAQLRERVAGLISLHKERGLGYRNLYTRLGTSAGALSWTNDDESKTNGWAHTIAGSDRTFCALPPDGKEAKLFFEETVNDKAASEIGAHMHMFTPKDNPGYYGMSERAKEIISEWVNDSWHIPVVDIAMEEPEVVNAEPPEEPEVVNREDLDSDTGSGW
jgi:pimeloyl-ACP methyl ester carboxylesterase